MREGGGGDGAGAGGGVEAGGGEGGREAHGGWGWRLRRWEGKLDLETMEMTMMGGRRNDSAQEKEKGC